MRLVATCLAFGFLISALPASSQTDSPFLEDPAGDAQASTLAPLPAGALAAYDLVSLSLQADATRLALRLTVASLQDETPLANTILYDMRFGFEGIDYRVVLERNIPALAATTGVIYRAQLDAFDPGTQEFQLVRDLDITANLAESSLSSTFELLDVRGASGLPARNGSTLQNVTVTTRPGVQEPLGNFGIATQETGEVGTGFLPSLVSDRMPNVGAAPYLLHIPTTSSQQVLLQSPDPVRATNGGPGTFVYPILATNLGDATVDVVPRLDGLPEAWSASFVDPRIQLGPRETRSSSLVVQPPFGHAHGAIVNLTVVALDPDAQPIGNELRLQLYYSDPAQPSGHHPTLYIHAIQPNEIVPLYALEEAAIGLTNRFGVMNVNDEDGRAVLEPIQTRNFEGGEGWFVPLSPGLALGLDFMAGATATFTGSFSSSNEVPVTDFSLAAQLVLDSPSERVVLAEAPATAPLELSKDGKTPIPLDLVTTEASDYVPYSKDSNLVLLLLATFTEPTGIGATYPSLEPGARLTLPLLEYQDAIPVQELGGLRVDVAEPVRQANPGSHVLFKLELSQDGSNSLQVDLEPLEVSKSAIVAIDPAHLQVRSGATHPVVVQVAVPQEAEDGDVLASYVTVRSSGSTQSLLVRLAVLVTTQTDVESQSLEGGRETPAPTWLAGLLAVGCAGLLRRRPA